MDEDRRGTQFLIYVDIPGRRTCTLRQFINHYTAEYFGKYAAQHYTLITYEPREAKLAFHNTAIGRELATMFKLGHECL